MDKNFLRDVIPPSHNGGHKKSIRNIPLSANAARRASQNNDDGDPIESKPPHRPVKTRRGRSSGSGKKLVTFILILLAIGYIVFGFTSAKAVISLSPETAEKELSTTFVAYNASTASFEDGEDTSGYIPYTVEEISVTQSTNVPATGEEEVQDKASGTITVFNEYSTEAQLLITNTRFESPDGKIYRVQKAINVPGMSGGQPGQLDVEVVADEAGASYNKDQAGVDFTIPGLKSTPEQYSKMYAKSKTAISGGFEGVRKVISDDEKAKTREQLRSDIIDSIETKVSESNSEDKFIIYNQESIIYTTLSDKVEGESVTVSEKASVPAIVFDRSVISNKIAQSVIRNDAEINVLITNLNDLSVSIANSNSFNPMVDTTADIDISGMAKFVWNVDVDALKEEFAGMSKGELTETLSQTSGISRARISIKPVWKQTVPSDTERIEILIDTENSEVDEQ